MARNIVRVLPHEREWEITLNKSREAIYGVKATAIDKAVELAKKNQPSQLLIHRADGTIEDERTYGDDPYPPKG